MSTRAAYPSDLSDEELALVAPFVPPNRGRGRHPSRDLREVVDAIFYLTREGCTWRGLRHGFPAWSTVHYYFDKWTGDGTWERINEALRRGRREAAGRDAEPTAGIIDSTRERVPGVKTTEAGAVRGYDAGKQVKGRKRHILVDTMGNLLYAWVHGADLQDAAGAEIVLEHGLAAVPTLRLVFADGGYDEDALHIWAWANTEASLEIVRGPQEARGFVLLPRRWVVGRTLAWLSRCRRLAKDFEHLIECSTSFLYIASTHLMARRLAKIRAKTATKESANAIAVAA